uniref:TNF family profile domain-containing protein n=1 Tax=Strix occidentalis caurina TaxID=311401 RepID=A0A8D0EUE9_STROC
MFLEKNLEKFGLGPGGLYCLLGHLRGSLVPRVSAGVLKAQEHSRETFPPELWELLLLTLYCIRFFCFCLYASVHIKQPISKKTFAIMGSSLLSSIPGESIKGVDINLTAEVGSIQIQNGSIMITHDGLYLVSLKGRIHFPDPDELTLTLWKTGKTTGSALWEQIVQDSGNAVNLMTVLYLFKEDNITLRTTKESHLSLAHIQRNPGFLYLLDSICI